MSLSSIELFAGAGGLAMGVSLAGFRSQSVVEWDKWACDTVRQNQQRGYPLVRDWPVVEGDVLYPTTRLTNPAFFMAKANEPPMSPQPISPNCSNMATAPYDETG